MDQNDFQNEPVQKTSRGTIRVPLGVFIICILLTGVFVFMATYVPLSLARKQEVDAAYGRFSKFEKLIELAELYDEKYLYTVDKELLDEALTSAYVYGNGDRFSYYYTAEEWLAEVATSAGNSVGIGVYIIFNPEEGLQVVQVMKDSPAKKAGVQIGDIITAIDGIKVLEAGYETAVGMVSGEIGTDVVLTVLRGGETLDLTITRGTYVPETVYGEILEVQGKKLGYVYITEFMSVAVTANQFKDTVRLLMNSGAEGLVFDVRDNPGGDLNAICSILDYLLPAGPIVHISYADSDEVTTMESDPSEIDLPMVVLTNGQTASAAELFTSALRDYEKAETVGHTTYGKGCGQVGEMLSDGSVVFLTNFLYSPPFSENYDGVGIVPDHEVSLSEEWQNKNLFLIPHNEDDQLIKAVEVLLSNISN